jgi:hypothetical protein
MGNVDGTIMSGVLPAIDSQAIINRPMTRRKAAEQEGALDPPA